MTLRVKSIIWWSWVGLSLATLVLTAGLAIFSLRYNNQVMGQLREAVFVADREDGDVEGALQRLRDHVIHHMNSDLVQNREVGTDVQTEKPIQLAHKYYRDTLAAHQSVVNELGPGMVGTLERARAVCEADGVPISERLVACKLKPGVWAGRVIRRSSRWLRIFMLLTMSALAGRLIWPAGQS